MDTTPCDNAHTEQRHYLQRHCLQRHVVARGEGGTWWRPHPPLKHWQRRQAIPQLFRRIERPGLGSARLGPPRTRSCSARVSDSNLFGTSRAMRAYENLKPELPTECALSRTVLLVSSKRWKVPPSKFTVSVVEISELQSTNEPLEINKRACLTSRWALQKWDWCSCYLYLLVNRV